VNEEIADIERQLAECAASLVRRARYTEHPVWSDRLSASLRHPSLAGESGELRRETLARQLGAFLFALHRFPAGTFLVDEPSGRLLAVVDWEAAALGDPACDFAVQFHVGDEFAEATLAAYAAQGGHVDASLRHRIRKQWELREFGGIRTALELNDQEEFADAIRKLKAGPLLAGPTRE
jgi:hypothetical protein